MKQGMLFFTLALFILLLAGCSKSDSPAAGGTPTQGSTPEGLWVGTTNTYRTIIGLILDDGTIYFLYSRANTTTEFGGVIQGTGTAYTGSFLSTSATDFNLEGLGVLSATVAATFTPRQSLAGSVVASAYTSTYACVYDTAYDATPSLAAVAGTFSGVVASSQGSDTATVTVVAPSGGFSGAATSGCTFSGTLTPRAHGNVFNMSLTFGGPPCPLANQTLSGIAYYDAATERIFAAAPTASRTDGVLFVGAKP